MKKLTKSLLVFLLTKIIAVYYSPLLNFRQYRNRKNVIEQFIAENNPTLKRTVSEFSRISLQYYRTFKEQNMLLLLTGTYLNDVDTFNKFLNTVTISGLDTLEKNKNKSIIGISYHIGPFSTIPIILAMNGYNVNLLVRSDTLYKNTKMDLEKINEAMARFARNHGFGIVRFIDSLSSLSLVLVRKCLKEGELLMIYPDTAKESSVSSLPVKFFNTLISGHIGIAKLYRFTKATVLPFSIQWEAKNKIELNIGEPMKIVPDSSDEDIVGAIYGPFEDKVSVNPEQWIQIESYEKFKY